MKSLIASSSFVLVASLLVACGGDAPPPAASPHDHHHDGHHGGEGHEGHHGDGDMKGEEHEHEHEGATPALKAFHEVLAPVWHSKAGAERTQKACAAVASMKEKAATTADATLVSNVAEVEKACAAPKEPEVEAALTKVHERFHALAEHH